MCYHFCSSLEPALQKFWEDISVTCKEKRKREEKEERKEEKRKKTAITNK
jgi:hypothetical protein